MLPEGHQRFTEAEIREIKMEHLCRWLYRMGPTMTWLPPRLPWQPSAMLVAANRASVVTRCTLDELRDYARKGAILLSEKPDYVSITLSDTQQRKYQPSVEDPCPQDKRCTEREQTFVR